MSETKQPDVQRGGPGPRKGLQLTHWSPVVDAAEAEPGEWFSVGVIGSPNNVYGFVYAEYARRYIEVRSDGDRVFVRVKP